MTNLIFQTFGIHTDTCAEHLRDPASQSTPCTVLWAQMLVCPHPNLLQGGALPVQFPWAGCNLIPDTPSAREQRIPRLVHMYSCIYLCCCNLWIFKSGTHSERLVECGSKQNAQVFC